MDTIVASHFLAGSLLTLLLPVGTLVAVGIYWTVLLRRRSSGARTGKTE
ncbi:MAG: hypothetical protein ACXVZ4_09485 [Gaiellaceae bacterium]